MKKQIRFCIQRCFPFRWKHCYKCSLYFKWEFGWKLCRKWLFQNKEKTNCEPFLIKGNPPLYLCKDCARTREGAGHVFPKTHIIYPPV